KTGKQNPGQPSGKGQKIGFKKPDAKAILSEPRSVKKQFPTSEPMSGPEIVLIVLLVLGFAVVVFLLLRQRKGAHNAEILQQLQSLESELRADFTKATADMAARVE